MVSDDEAADAASGWTLVLPVQSPARAKSRLEVPAGVDRPALARSIARDALAAVRATTAVARRVVVTADEETAAQCRTAGDHVERDSGRSLTEAVRRGVEAARAIAPDAPTAVLLADVPALTSEELAAALDAVGAVPFAVVPDAEGSGSVLLAAARADLLRPAFGPDSARRHQRAGAVRLDLDLPRLRRDVDTWAALVEAAHLGLGPATAALLERAGVATPFAAPARCAH